MTLGQRFVGSARTESLVAMVTMVASSLALLALFGAPAVAAPISTSAATPIETPIEPTVETPIETPTETRSETLIVTPIATPIAATSAGPVLTVETVIGDVHSERPGSVASEARLLKAGDALAERDLLRTSADARLILRLAGSGLIELGPDASLSVEKLPPDLDAEDRRNVLSLWRGYLHVVWTPPADDAARPTFLFFGGQRASLNAGEYFFERDERSVKTCVATGQLTAMAIAANATETLAAATCYEFNAARSIPFDMQLAARADSRDADVWESMRQAFALDGQPRPLSTRVDTVRIVHTVETVRADPLVAAAPEAAPVAYSSLESAAQPPLMLVPPVRAGSPSEVEQVAPTQRPILPILIPTELRQWLLVPRAASPSEPRAVKIGAPVGTQSMGLPMEAQVLQPTAVRLGE